MQLTPSLQPVNYSLQIFSYPIYVPAFNHSNTHPLKGRCRFLLPQSTNSTVLFLSVDDQCAGQCGLAVKMTCAESGKAHKFMYANFGKQNPLLATAWQRASLSSCIRLESTWGCHFLWHEKLVNNQSFK